MFLKSVYISSKELPSGSPIVLVETYWQQARNTRTFPHPDDIDPLTLPRAALPWVFLLDVLESDGNRDFRYRLNGTLNVRLFGRNPTGALVSDVFSDADQTFMIETFSAPIIERNPVYTRAFIRHPRIDRVEVDRGLFPYSSDGDKIDRLLGIAVPPSGFSDY